MKKPGLSRREINRRFAASADRLLNRAKNKPAAESEQPKPAPKSGSLSHEKLASKRSVFYQPHRAKGTVFRDVRGVVNQVEASGAVRAAGKPRSRVKREREQQGQKEKENAAARKSRTPGSSSGRK